MQALSNRIATEVKEPSLPQKLDNGSERPFASVTRPPLEAKRNSPARIELPGGAGAMRE